MKTFATLFSGGELAGVGMQAAGLRHLWGIERDPAIAGVAASNGMPPIVADILDVDPHGLEAPWALHASPVCTRASNANQSAEINEEGTKEAPADIAMGEKVAQFIDVLRPRVFTLENVYAYRNFRAFKIICAALSRGGYFWDYDHLNSANFSVPQTRKRLVLRAVHGRLLPNLPAPEPWVGWYAAIEDLIPGLPASRFARWQLARLPNELAESMLVDSAGYPGSDGVVVPVMRGASAPANVIVANFERRPMRAFILAGGGNTNLAEAEPGRGVRYGGEPMHSVTPVTAAGGTMPRAWLVDGQLGSSGERLNILEETYPAATVRGGTNHMVGTRAFLVDQQNAGRDTTIRTAGEPSFTISVHSTKHPPPRAWLSAGRVVAMTPRALARFQSVPDSYILPDKPSLACRVIGNGVPCLMFEKLYRGLTAGAA